MSAWCGSLTDTNGVLPMVPANQTEDALTDDSTVVDPSGHRIVLDNEHVRILEVRVSEGASLTLHSHPPRVVVAIGSYRLMSTDEAGHTTIVDRRPGDVAWSDGEDHSAEVVVGPVHAIEVEVKSAREQQHTTAPSGG